MTTKLGRSSKQTLMRFVVSTPLLNPILFPKFHLYSRHSHTLINWNKICNHEKENVFSTFEKKVRKMQQHYTFHTFIELSSNYYGWYKRYLFLQKVVDHLSPSFWNAWYESYFLIDIGFPIKLCNVVHANLNINVVLDWTVTISFQYKEN